MRKTLFINPLFTRQITQLVDAFVEIDQAVDSIERAKGTSERWQLEELSERLQELIPLVDTVPLPGSARRAGRDVGDFFYLLDTLCQKALKEDTEKSQLPTVREARKYDENPFESSIQLDPKELEEMYIYRTKARETLRKPANNYGLSCDKSFAPYMPDEKIDEPSSDYSGKFRRKASTVS
ncbi:MAG: hypothetical protein FWD93_03790 [Coriobacteriia bacterium]|nr:hypothetical protein [Coriobacteriia bacterium]